MCQRIHSGGGSDARRQAKHEVRIKRDCHRNQLVVHDGEFPLGLRIGDDRDNRDFGARAGGGRDGEERQHRLAHLEVPVQRLRAAALCTASDDRLGRIDRRSPAHCQNRIGAGLLHAGNTFHHNGDRRIRLDIGIHVGGDPGCLQCGQHGIYDLQVQQHCIGYHQDRAQSAVGDHPHELSGRPWPGKDEWRRRRRQLGRNPQPSDTQSFDDVVQRRDLLLGKDRGVSSLMLWLAR